MKCHQEKCENTYTMRELQKVFERDVSSFTQIDQALTLKVMRASEEYVSCPNKACKGFGFYRPEMLCCPDNFECTDCETQWRMPG